MKKRKNVTKRIYGAICLLLVQLMLLSASGCKKSTTDDTQPSSESVEQETAAPEGDDTPAVKYEIRETTTVYEEFDSAKLGSVVSSQDKNVTTLISAAFDSADELAGKASAKDDTLVSVSDGVFRMPYKDGAFISGWTTWSPEISMQFDRYKQIQLSCDMSVPQADGTANWLGAFWGCYVSDYTSKIPDQPGDGLWFSFSRENKLTIYGADIASWPVGFVSVELPVNISNAKAQISIVCSEDKNTSVFASVNGVQTLVCKVTFTDGTMTVSDSSGQVIYSHEADVKTLAGDHFVLFTHMGAIEMDNFEILGCNKAYTETTKEIVATPSAGHSLGLDYDKANELISICYSIWFDGILGSGTEPVTDFNNITEVLEGKRDWGSVTAFHYWAKPAQGYYRSSDKQAAKNNLQLLGDADVDFLILDLTNHNDGYAKGSQLWNSWVKAPIETLLDSIMEMRADGKKVPYVVMWVGESEGKLFDDIYDTFYTQKKWEDCFVYSEGKPFMLLTTDTDEFVRADKFTVRKMWGLTSERNIWRFLNIDNKNTAAVDKNGSAEQISVAVASQETYMSASTAHGRNKGEFWYTQWTEAFRVHPKVVTLTWWNEWAAQRFDVDGKICFTDNYNTEYSRDIEPMEGGHGDLYYRWLCEYVRAYRAGEECPHLVEE